MKAASIDIGTNTVLLLVAELQKGGIHVLEENERIPRLGKGVDKEKNLHPDSIRRVLKALNEYKSFLETKYPKIVLNTIVTATSAVRDASNKKEFLDRVKKETGWDVWLLSGLDEARTTYKGALSVLDDRSKSENLILDIGGGSTELAYGTGYQLKHASSIDMGSVRFTERFFRSDPPTSDEIQTVSKEIQYLLQKEQVPEKNVDLIGVAGTVTAIAGVILNFPHHYMKRMNGLRLLKSSVENFIREFSTIPSSEIERKYPEFLKGRGEVILAGILILREVMEWICQDSVIITTGGIRHGILLNQLGEIE